MGSVAHRWSFLDPNLWGVVPERIRPFSRTISTMSLMLVVEKTVSSVCFDGRSRIPWAPWPVVKTSNESTMSTSGIVLRARETDFVSQERRDRGTGDGGAGFVRGKIALPVCAMGQRDETRVSSYPDRRRRTGEDARDGEREEKTGKVGGPPEKGGTGTERATHHQRSTCWQRRRLGG